MPRLSLISGNIQVQGKDLAVVVIIKSVTTKLILDITTATTDIAINFLMSGKAIKGTVYVYWQDEL